jgi:hypothetical protein
LLWGALTLLGGAVCAVTAKLVNDEIRGWLDLLPHIILRLAAKRLRPGQREAIYQDEWVPELAYILKEAETRPITRLVRGVRFSLGLLISATRVARHLNRAPARQAASTPDATSPAPQLRGHEAALRGDGTLITGLPVVVTEGPQEEKIIEALRAEQFAPLRDDESRWTG